MLRLAQAASSENYSAWGIPPNQRRTPGKLDGELNIVPFYGGWEYVFRPKSEAVAEMIAWLMEGAVENGTHIGYSQCNGDYPREGVFDALFEMVNPDTRKINTLVNCDCSSLTGACVYSAGKKDASLYDPSFRTMWTGSERQLLMSTGSFVELTDPLLLELGTGLRRGDILLKTGHTAVAIDSDNHQDSFPVIIKDCYQSQVRSGPDREYDSMGIVNAGTILNALGTTVDEDGRVWFRVLYEGGVGYTSSKYADRLPEGKCSGDTWLRETPGTKGKQIIVIPKGGQVYLSGKIEKAWSGAVLRDWFECVYGGHIGWASGLYLMQK